MRAVLKYPGAKNRLANWIVDHIPEHKVYCEPLKVLKRDAEEIEREM